MPAVSSAEHDVTPEFPAITDNKLIPITNAAHAADKEHSWVKLAVVKKDDFYIEVSDNGCGMDEKTRERVFDPFFTTKTSSDGFGLGLYVCHSLVGALGGRIEMDSELGKGSTFRIMLPRTHSLKQEDQGRTGQTVN